MKPGHIRIIDNKVKFEYYKLEKPKELSWSDGIVAGYDNFIKAVAEYEASKQLMEVSNEYLMLFEKILWINNKSGRQKFIIKNNQPCKAEITDNKATIVELIK